MAMPVKFFGVSANSVETETDAIAAIDDFIRYATDKEFDIAVSELDQLDDARRTIINSLVWQVDYNLMTKEWERAFELKWHSAS